MRSRLAASQSECGRLQEDNVKLYERVRFLQVTRIPPPADVLTPTPKPDAPPPPAPTAAARGGERRETEARYSQLYEERINPFAAFARRERQARYAQLSPPEKLVHAFASFFLADRHARLFLFGYMVCMHLLVTWVMYSVTHRRKC